MLIARLLLAQHKPLDGLALLEHLLAAAETAGRQQNVLKMQLLLSLIYAELGNTTKVNALLTKILAFAYTQNYRRLFLDEGPALEKLLRQLAPTLSRSKKELRAYLQTLLLAYEQPAKSMAIPLSTHNNTFLMEPLSKQEEKVLRLLAAGQTNPQIARELMVSINTVRTQVQSIFRKLDVNNRQEASQVARQHHLV